ncbi:MAG: hypothetical protein ACLTCQ_08000 [Enterocloster bolteae]
MEKHPSVREERAADMWMLIAAVGAGVFIYQFLTELLKGRYSILETRLNEIAGIGRPARSR